MATAFALVLWLLFITNKTLCKDKAQQVWSIRPGKLLGSYDSFHWQMVGLTGVAETSVAGILDCIWPVVHATSKWERKVSKLDLAFSHWFFSSETWLLGILKFSQVAINVMLKSDMTYQRKSAKMHEYTKQILQKSPITTMLDLIKPFSLNNFSHDKNNCQYRWHKHFPSMFCFELEASSVKWIVFV